MSDNSRWIKMIQNLRKQSDSEFKLGNEGAAALFLNKANQLIAKYSINEEDLIEKLNEVIINQLGKSVIINPFLRINARTNLRMFWFEELAKVVSEGYYCKSEPNSDNGEVGVYGYDFDRDIAIFMLLKIAEIANKERAKYQYESKANVGKPPIKKLKGGDITFPEVWMGDEVFTDSFHYGFRLELSKILSKHESNDFTIKKVGEVRDYYKSESNYNEDWDRNYKQYKEYNLNPDKMLNEEAMKLGEISGSNVMKKVQVSNENNGSAITIKGKTAIDTNAVYLLIDDSYSMHGNRISEAKKGAIEYTKVAIEKGFAVGLIAFGSKVIHIKRPTKELDDKFYKAIDKLEAMGDSTNMSGAIRHAVSRFLDRRYKRTIVIVTDGMPDSINDTLSIATQAKRQGIEIVAIGVEGANEEFLKKLSSKEELGLLVGTNRLMLTMGELANKL